MSGIEVWIDQRERHVIPYFDAIDWKKAPPYKLELKTLSAGDYAVVYRDYIIMLIERKSWADLAATFLDRNRKFNYEKMIEERNKFGCHLFYLVEGHRPAHGIHHVTIEMLESHLDHLLFDHNIVTLYSQSVEKTPERILSLVKHYMTAHSNPFKTIEEKVKVLNPIPIPEEKSGPPVLQLDLVSNGKIVVDPNVVIAPSASDSLGTSKKHSDQAMEYKLWNCIEGMTEPNYIALRDIGVTLGGLLANQYTVAQLGHAKYRLGTMVGDKKLGKIINSASDPATHIKIMSNIPQMSAHKAQYVLKNYNMLNIITGVVDEKQLSDLVIPSEKKTTQLNIQDMSFGSDMLNSGGSGNNGRRLGTIAKNIIKYLRTPS